MFLNKGRFNKRTFVSWLKNSYIFIVMFVIYAPLVVIVLLSFCGQTEKWGNINLNFGAFSTENYAKLFQDDDFLNSLFNTLIICVIVAPTSMIIATCTCFGLWNKKNLTQKAIMTSSKLSVVTPDVITGVSLFLLFNSTLIPMGVNLGLFTVVLAHISFCTPYAIITIYPKMMKMPKNLVLASYDLGYGKIKTFFKITVPYLLPVLIGGTMIVIATSFDDFVITNLINGSYNTISINMYTARNGVKAWIVTFGAIMILIFTAYVAFSVIYKSVKHKKGLKNANK